MNTKALSREQELEVCRLYQEGTSAYDLGRRFGCSYGPIYTCLKAWNIERRDRAACQRQYSFDEHFFDNVQEEAQAYWLGFLAADTFIALKRPTVVTNLAAVDREHLVCLNEALVSTVPLYDYQANGHPATRLTLHSAHLQATLARYGVGPGKVATRTWPSLPAALYRHYVRGYFDGDGTFRSSTGNRIKKDGSRSTNAALQIKSPRQMTAAIQTFLEAMLGLLGGSHAFEQQSNASWCLRYHGNARCLPVINLLYEGATAYLPRKRNLVLAHYRSLPQYRDQLKFG